jgi:hypothetical protein
MHSSEHDIQQLLDALYQSICFAKDEQPTFESLRELFLPQGILVNNNNSATPLVLSVSAFIEAIQSAIATGGLEEFHEREIARKIEVFGNIAHVFSTYEARFDRTAQDPFSIGINTIQLVRVGESGHQQWRVAAMAWNDQTAEERIPAGYLAA